MTKVGFAAYNAAKMCVAKKDIRTYLNGFYIDPAGFLVATDGHRCFVGVIETDITNGIVTAVIGREPAKFKYASFVLETKMVEFFNAEDTLLLSLPFVIPEGRYPDWRRINNHNPGNVSAICFYAKYLADVAKLMKYYKKSWVSFSFQQPNESCRIQLSDTDFITLMPQRV